MIGRKAFILLLTQMIVIVACQTESGQESLGSTLEKTEYRQPTFEFKEICDDVYLAMGNPLFLAGCNAAIIINESDVVIVDSNISPQAAAILLERLREITTKPVRYVINTHFHFDHVYGNQLYALDADIRGN